MDEAQLSEALARAQRGSAAAFGEIYQHYSRRVFGLCRRILGSTAAAEDATSEVFERARNALDQYAPQRPFERWLLTIASRHCLNVLRRRHVERRWLETCADEPLASEAPLSPLEVCEGRAERRALQRAIDELPEEYRIPLVLKYYGDLSYDEIAEQMAISRNHVAVRLHRAKLALRERVAASRSQD